MRPPFSPSRLPVSLLLAGCLTLGVLLWFTGSGDSHQADTSVRPAGVTPKPGSCWQVEDVKPGQKGYGLTVMRGTRVERFSAEVIGVLKNTSPGRDMVLCRLAGLDLERSGIIAGMSGSPVYIDNKLLGAVAFGWAYGKDPIAGITPFSQMQSWSETYERRDQPEQNKARRVGTRHPLPTPLKLGDRSYDAVSVAQDVDEDNEEGLWLRPLRTPLVASGMSANALRQLKGATRGLGLVPLQGGAATATIAAATKSVNLEPGGPLSVALIRGDFDLSGIGTVTHIEGQRVYGWGHPFMSMGGCEFPLMTGWIHTIYPRQSISFKMGSPLREVGVINADVSTCIAGWLGKKADMMPLKMTVSTGPETPPHVFNVEMVRQKNLLASLVFTSMVNSIDMEGELPEEMTADLSARIHLENGEPLEVKDTFSGFSGGRAGSALYGHIASMVSLLANNPYKPIRISRIESETRVEPGRKSADIEAVELESEVYQPGETLRARVHLRPWKGELKTVRVTLKLPHDLPEGSYSASVGDDLSAVRSDLRDRPALGSPQNAEQVLAGVRHLTTARRTSIAVRLALGTTGVALEGKELPDLPESMVKLLGSGRRSGSQSIRSSITERTTTPWVIQGQESVSFKVTRNKKVTAAQ